MKPSRYNVFVEDNNKIYAVNLLSRTSMVWGKEAYQRYINWSEGDVSLVSEQERLFAEALLQNLFILPNDIDEVEIVKEKSKIAQNGNNQLGLVISPTMGCNFNCHYCFEQKVSNQISQKNQRKLLNLVEEQIEDYESVSVQWFGGEPLLTYDIIQSLSTEFINLCQRHNKPYKATVITNGYHLKKDISKSLNKLGIERIQITLDGSKNMHDKIRSPSDRSGSFDQILENIYHIPSNVEVDIRIHVAPYNKQSVRLLLEELSSHECKDKITSIYFAPLFNYKVGMSSTPYEADTKKF